MSAKVFWIILAGLAIFGMALIRHYAKTSPQGIDPRAAEKIEKAKQR